MDISHLVAKGEIKSYANTKGSHNFLKEVSYLVQLTGLI